ncbi:AQJ64_40280 family protein [Winogradskya humida]|uniref:AQJ64_40280 family protein n=1 Tax=Winogradskya humida TaxID=113566 RepID=UPI0027DE7571|nr:AQJ64_40280 family protein [Actinoplanes humidus]
MENKTDAIITWIDARLENPPDGVPVLAAVTGRYPADEGDFWLVMALHFRSVHPVEGTDQVIRDRYWDSDQVTRKPYDPVSKEGVTHWAALPPLPGAPTSLLMGAPVASALAAVTGLAA